MKKLTFGSLLLLLTITYAEQLAINQISTNNIETLEFDCPGNDNLAQSILNSFETFKANRLDAPSGEYLFNAIYFNESFNSPEPPKYILDELSLHLILPTDRSVSIWSYHSDDLGECHVTSSSSFEVGL